jgi:hypothetical protein
VGTRDGWQHQATRDVASCRYHWRHISAVMMFHCTFPGFFSDSLTTSITPQFSYHYCILQHAGTVQGGVRNVGINSTRNILNNNRHLCNGGGGDIGGWCRGIFTPSPANSETLTVHVEPICPGFSSVLRRYTIFEINKCASGAQKTIM